MRSVCLTQTEQGTHTETPQPDIFLPFFFGGVNYSLSTLVTKDGSGMTFIESS